MATTQIEEKPRIITPRNTRRNEIVAIVLLAFGLLLALCLVSAAFYPNDPSWNSAGQAETHNLAGTIGANVAAALFQFVALAAYLLAIAATGLLLATNFSFIGLYERIIEAFGSRFSSLRVLSEKLKVWREARRERSRLRKEAKLAAKAERAAARSALKQSRELTG